MTDSKTPSLSAAEARRRDLEAFVALCAAITPKRSSNLLRAKEWIFAFTSFSSDEFAEFSHVVRRIEVVMNPDRC